MEGAEDEKGTPTPPAPTPAAAATIPEPPKADSVLQRVVRGDDTLTDAELQAAGLDEDTRKAYRSDVKTRAEAATAAAVAEAGGAEEYAKLTAWASANLSAEDRAAFNRMVTKGSASERRLAINGLAQRYRTEAGVPGKTFFGGGKAAAGAEPFTTSKEVTTAMGNPKWNTDPEYREQVRARLRVTRMADLDKAQSTTR